MPKITPSYELYLYQLFSQQLGIGKQVPLPRLQEVLDEDDIKPEDLECADLNELAKSLESILKLTLFRKGRAYVTVIKRDDLDAALTASAEGPAKKATPASGGPLSWKHKKSSKRATHPVKPGKKRRQQEARAAAAEAARQELAEEVAEEPTVAATDKHVQAEAAHSLEAPEKKAAESSSPQAETHTAPEQPAEATAPKRMAPVLAPEPTIKLDISYDPSTDLPEFGGARASFQEITPLKPNTELPPNLPRELAHDLLLSDEHLQQLYELLPFDVEPTALLDGDWLIARATGTLSASNGRLSFPLRYNQADGTPVIVTIRRIARTATGKRWTIDQIDSGSETSTGGMEGLPLASEGAWSKFAPTASPTKPSALQLIASTISIGSWESFLESIAEATEPEAWDYPEEAGATNTHLGVLRDYITATMAHVVHHGGIAAAQDGSFAAFNTGLLSPEGEAVYACLRPRKDNIRWSFAGCATAGSGEMGSQLATLLEELPHVPHYLKSIDDLLLTPEHSCSVTLNTLPKQQRECLGSSLEAAVTSALRRARQSYRLIAPAYDPVEDRVHLLLPLSLATTKQIDCALALSQEASGGYRAAAILTLPCAYALARIISKEQPRWLSRA